MSNCWKSHALARGVSSDILTGITVFNCALHRLMHKSFVTTFHRAGERRGLWFSGYRSMVWPCTNSVFAWLLHGYKWLVHIISFVFMHQSFVTPPQLRGMLRTLTLCLQFPIVTTILRGQLAGITMTVLPRSLVLYCTAMFVFVYQTPTFPPHCGDNVQVKTQHIISHPAQRLE